MSMMTQDSNKECRHEMEILFSFKEKGIRNDVRKCTKCEKKDSVFFPVKNEQKE
jgi:hypothetical protein